MMFTGEVTNMDMTAKTMTAKGKKGDMTFDVSGAKMKGEAKAGGQSHGEVHGEGWQDDGLLGHHGWS